MWVTLFALLTAASVCVGMVTFSLQAQQTQSALDSLPDRAAALMIDHSTTKDQHHPG
jgi:hypothetical protein